MRRDYHRLSGFSGSAAQRPTLRQAQLVRTASRQALAGIALLGVALVAVTYLVADVLFQPLVAIAVTAALLLLAVATWLVLPLRRRLAGNSVSR